MVSTLCSSPISTLQVLDNPTCMRLLGFTSRPYFNPTSGLSYDISCDFPLLMEDKNEDVLSTIIAAIGSQPLNEHIKLLVPTSKDGSYDLEHPMCFDARDLYYFKYDIVQSECINVSLKFDAVEIKNYVNKFYENNRFANPIPCRIMTWADGFIRSKHINSINTRSVNIEMYGDGKVSGKITVLTNNLRDIENAMKDNRTSIIFGHKIKNGNGYKKVSFKLNDVYLADPQTEQFAGQLTETTFEYSTIRDNVRVEFKDVKVV